MKTLQLASRPSKFYISNFMGTAMPSMTLGMFSTNVFNFMIFFRCTQATKHPSKLIHPGFGTQGRHHQKSKTGVSVALQKGLVPSKN